MKTKKILAILGAAMCSCCAVGGAAFAEETEPVDYSQYQLGDITMDGIVDVDDAQLALQCYTLSLAELPQHIPYEQQLLGCVKGYTRTYVIEDENGTIVRRNPYVADLLDSTMILVYYADSLAEKGTAGFDEELIRNCYEYDLAQANQKTGPRTFRDSTLGSFTGYETLTVEKVR
ncbi:MAG: hypothetical protein IJ060_04250 [Oscillospiraceae bacterium]|nr:hypothetical protein [Oscillospiraceae bacterium]